MCNLSLPDSIIDGIIIRSNTYAKARTTLKLTILAPEGEDDNDEEMDNNNDDDSVDDETINEDDDDHYDKVEQEKWYYKAKFMLDWINKFAQRHCVHPT